MTSLLCNSHIYHYLFQFTSWVDAVIFVFSLENEASFNAIYNYYVKMSQFRNMQEIPLILVGTQGKSKIIWSLIAIINVFKRVTIFIIILSYFNLIIFRRNKWKSTKSNWWLKSKKTCQWSEAMFLLRDMCNIRAKRRESISRR